MQRKEPWKFRKNMIIYEYEYDIWLYVRGSIICSHATWYEQGERNTKYFLNLENSIVKKKLH